MLPKEYSWLISHPEIESNYAGEYIAIVDDSIVAHGKNLKQVMIEAKKINNNPFIHKVFSSDKVIVV